MSLAKITSYYYIRSTANLTYKHIFLNLLPDLNFERLAVEKKSIVFSFAICFLLSSHLLSFKRSLQIEIYTIYNFKLDRQEAGKCLYHSLLEFQHHYLKWKLTLL